MESDLVADALQLVAFALPEDAVDVLARHAGSGMYSTRAIRAIGLIISENSGNRIRHDQSPAEKAASRRR
jgi:hypothetical protein